MIASERLYVTADRSRVVPEGDPLAVFLLAAKGTTLSKADVEKYGLEKPAAKTETAEKTAVASNPAAREKRVPGKLQSRG